MFSKLARLIRFWLLLNKDEGEGAPQEQAPQLSGDLDQDLELVRRTLGNSHDLVIRKFSISAQREVRAAIFFIDGLIDKKEIAGHVLRPLMISVDLTGVGNSGGNIFTAIKEHLLTMGDIKEEKMFGAALAAALAGNTVLLVEGVEQALVIDTRGWEKRAIERPQTELGVRGSQEGFVETLRDNTALLRRKIRDPHLTMEFLQLGKRTRTDVVVAYLKGVANNQVVEEVKRRLQRIDTDAILESGYIEQFIEDAPFSPFATIANSEKPDKVAGKLLEGRVAILTDGTPFVLTVPMVFIESFQAADDYYSRPYFSSFVRGLRFLAFALSILAPAVYVALTTFHQELIPTPLLITMASAREGTPFPSMLEALGMMLVFEILREAGVRMPRPLGQAVNIVGALVIGEAAVSAGLIGAPMVIVVAITAIASFLVPPEVDAGEILRLALILLGGTFGLFGIVLGLIELLIHLASLRSFGTPYLSPFAPASPADFKDTLVRAPFWMMVFRPRSISRVDPQRQGFRLFPEPPEGQPQEGGN